MNNNMQFYKSILEKLRDDFDSLDMATILSEPSDNVPTYMLNVLHTELSYDGEEVMGEYYFLPFEDENTRYHVFTSMLTLTEEMPEERYEDLGRAANLLNFYLPVGSFVFSKPEGIMAYKHSCLIPKGYSMEEAFKLIDGHIAMSLNIVNQYLSIFMRLLKREISFTEFLNTLPNAFWM